MTQFLQLFGSRLSMMFAAIALLYLLWSTAPLWWSARRAFLRADRLVHPWSFIFIAGMLAYGSTALAAMGVTSVVGMSRLLDGAAHPWLLSAIAPGTWLATRLDSWLPPALLPLHLLMTWFITRQLSDHWRGLCTRGALSGRKVR